MFSIPDIDKNTSIKMVIHIVKVENEYVPTLELVYPTEEDITVETLFAMQDGAKFARDKIDKVLDVML